MPERTSSKKNTKLKREGEFDYTLLLVVVFLILFGLLMIYSTTYYAEILLPEGELSSVMTQAVASLIGLAVMVVTIFIPYRFWERFGLLAYIISILLIAAVLVPGWGRTKNGATRWLEIYGQSLQPVEIVKIAIIIFMAVMISKMGKTINQLRSTMIIMLMVLIICAEVLIITDNLSSSIILFGIAFAMIFVANKNYKGFIFLAFLGIVVAVALVFLVVTLNENPTVVAGGMGFRGLRILSWLEPEKYIDDTGLQTMQSLYAIGSGGVFGKGLGESVQKLGSLPEAHNDMIFSIICEELGLLGGLSVIILYIILIWRMFIIAQRTKDLFGAMLVIGVMAHFAIQVTLNIAVVTNTMPNTGVTLPFISAGGSSVVFLLVEIGLVLSVSRGIRVKEGM